MVQYTAATHCRGVAWSVMATWLDPTLVSQLLSWPSTVATKYQMQARKLISTLAE